MNTERIGSTRLIKATAKPGIIAFTFTDRWSAFDRGAAEQTIPGIGKARCDCAVASFEIAKRNGLDTHFIDRIDDTTMHVQEFEIPDKPLLSGRQFGRFLALEWIWRAYIKGSLWERIEKGEIGPIELGFPEGTVLKEGMKLPRLFLECTTKLEDVDRHLSDDEARSIAGLNEKEWARAQSVLVDGVTASNEIFAKAGFDSLDGKAELGMRSDGRFVFVDIFGGPDENRLIHIATGEPYSKDFKRNYLKSLPWKAELDAAKNAHPHDKSKWPKYPILPPDFVEEDSLRYQEVALGYSAAAA